MGGRVSHNVIDINSGGSLTVSKPTEESQYRITTNRVEWVFLGTIKINQTLYAAFETKNIFNSRRVLIELESRFRPR